MKKLLLISAIALAASSISLRADNTDTRDITASGNIITALSIGNAAGNIALVMPDLVQGESGTPATVKLACDASTAGVVTYGGNGNPYADGTASETSATVATSANTGLGNKTGTCATVTVNGEANYNFEIALTNNSIAANNGVTLTKINCSGGADGASVTKTLDGNGTLDIFCGGTVSATESAADYSLASAATVAVTYD